MLPQMSSPSRPSLPIRCSSSVALAISVTVKLFDSIRRPAVRGAIRASLSLIQVSLLDVLAQTRPASLRVSQSRSASSHSLWSLRAPLGVRRQLQTTRSIACRHPNSTTGMQTATLGKRGGKAVGPDFDRKTGLLAHDNKRLVEGNATWIISGPKQPARANGNGPPSAFSRSALFNSSAETAAAGGSGKKGKTEKQRMQEDHNLVRKLQKRDGGKTVGGKYLIASTSKEAMPPAEGESEEEGDKSIKAGKKAFASSHLRKLGFDPTRKEDAVRTADESVDEQRQKVRSRCLSPLRLVERCTARGADGYQADHRQARSSCRERRGGLCRHGASGSPVPEGKSLLAHSLKASPPYWSPNRRSLDTALDRLHPVRLDLRSRHRSQRARSRQRSWVSMAMMRCNGSWATSDGLAHES